jgi:hypothetical protein
MKDAGSDFIRVGMLGDLPICLADNYSSENSKDSRQLLRYFTDCVHHAGGRPFADGRQLVLLFHQFVVFRDCLQWRLWHHMHHLVKVAAGHPRGRMGARLWGLPVDKVCQLKGRT